jgi:DNA-directed RNA polymerase III subunit RPC6
MNEYIKKLGIIKGDLDLKDIETILDTLVYDGKVEKSISLSLPISNKTSDCHISNYRAIDQVLDKSHGSSFIRTPCGICPLIDNCHNDGDISPYNCAYINDWLEF